LAERIDRADGMRDADTMAVAEAQQALYESRVWVDEWLEQKPPPTNRFALSRFREDSQNRFAQWSAWRLQQQGRKPLASRVIYRFAKAVRIKSNLTTGQIRSEGTIRPLAWMVKYGYEDRIPEVEAIAVELAGSADALDSGHMRKALTQWKNDVLTPKGIRQAQKASKAEQYRARVVSTFDRLLELAKTDQEAKAKLIEAVGYIEDTLEQENAA